MNDKKAKIYEYFRGETDNEELYKALCEFYENRTEMNRPVTLRAAKMIIKELDRLAPKNDKLKIAIINQSIYYGWRGVFPLRSTNPPSSDDQVMHDSIFNNMTPKEFEELAKATRIKGEQKW